MSSNPSSSKPVALITGANKGIGYEIARQLGRDHGMTVLFAAELAAEGSPIKVNSVCPGYVATDLNNHQGPRTVEQGAREPVRLATLPADGPTGGFFDEGGPVPW